MKQLQYNLCFQVNFLCAANTDLFGVLKPKQNSCFALSIFRTDFYFQIVNVQRQNKFILHFMVLSFLAFVRGAHLIEINLDDKHRKSGM
jgi:hypothetical protein